MKNSLLRPSGYVRWWWSADTSVRPKRKLHKFEQHSIEIWYFLFRLYVAFGSAVARADNSVVIKATRASALPTTAKPCRGPRVGSAPRSASRSAIGTQGLTTLSSSRRPMPPLSPKPLLELLGAPVVGRNSPQWIRSANQSGSFFLLPPPQQSYVGGPRWVRLRSAYCKSLVCTLSA